MSLEKMMKIKKQMRDAHKANEILQNDKKQDALVVGEQVELNENAVEVVDKVDATIIRPRGRPKKIKSKEEQAAEAVKKTRGRPRKHDLTRNEYMKNYMKEYNGDNKERVKQRNSSRYYCKINNVPDEIRDHLGIHGALVLKAHKLLQEIKERCPEHLDPLLTGVYDYETETNETTN
jgi:virulence-associated protein VagC